MRNHATPTVTLLLMLLAVPCAAQKTDSNNEAALDEKGNIFVSSDAGRLIWMAHTRHCSESIFATDRQTIGCMVAPSTDIFPPAPSLKLEIYLRGGEKRTIEPGVPIMDWHFWEGGREVAVHSGLNVRHGTYTLYESATARVIEELAEPADEESLPQWAKSQAQIQDEAVPMSTALGIEFVSRREGVATGDAMGRLFVTIISAIAELERSLVVERVKSGMRRARLEGRQIGRSRLDVDRQQVIQDRRSGMSLTQVAKKHGISRASVCRLMNEATSNPDAPVPARAGNMPEQACTAGVA